MNIWQNFFHEEKSVMKFHQFEFHEISWNSVSKNFITSQNNFHSTLSLTPHMQLIQFFFYSFYCQSTLISVQNCVIEKLTIIIYQRFYFCWTNANYFSNLLEYFYNVYILWLNVLKKWYKKWHEQLRAVR
jgi:hypothetical protein